MHMYDASKGQYLPKSPKRKFLLCTNTHIHNRVHNAQEPEEDLQTHMHTHTHIQQVCIPAKEPEEEVSGPFGAPEPGMSGCDTGIAPGSAVCSFLCIKNIIYICRMCTTYQECNTTSPKSINHTHFNEHTHERTHASHITILTWRRVHAYEGQRSMNLCQ